MRRAPAHPRPQGGGQPIVGEVRAWVLPCAPDCPICLGGTRLHHELHVRGHGSGKWLAAQAGVTPELVTALRQSHQLATDPTVGHRINTTLGVPVLLIARAMQVPETLAPQVMAMIAEAVAS